MNNAGDAAEQIIRISLMGAEYTFRITGTAVKNIAAFLFAAISSGKANAHQKLSGKEHLNTMLRSGKEVKVFKLRNSDLRAFYKKAKLYGVVYTLVRDKKGDWSDLMVKAEDASKINRIMEDIELVPSGQLSPAPEAPQTEPTARNTESRAVTLDDILRGLDPEDAPAEHTPSPPGNGRESPERTEPEAPDTLFPTRQQEPMLTRREELAAENPSPARTARSRLSEPSYASRSRYERASSEQRPSVRQELKEIAERRKGADNPVRERPAQTFKRPESQQSPIPNRVLTRKKSSKER